MTKRPTTPVPPCAPGIAATIDPSREKNLVAQASTTMPVASAIANTRGNFGYTRNSLASFTTTVRTADGTGSGWGSAMSHRIGDVNAKAVGARAVEKAELSKNPVAIEPGNYTVILEPNAVGDLVSFMTFFFARARPTRGAPFSLKRAAGISSAKSSSAIRSISTPTRITRPRPAIPSTMKAYRLFAWTSCVAASSRR